MSSVTIEELFIVTYVLVDDWVKKSGYIFVGQNVGAKPAFTVSEMLTLMIAIDFFEFTSERRYLSFVRANYPYLFPNLLDQSQFNRRTRSLRHVLDQLRREWANRLGVQWENHFLLDTTPVIVVGYRRDKTRSNFYGSADYGYCSARKLKYYGYKLVMLTTLDGTPYAFELVPANTDERDAADEILDTLPPNSDVWSDKGFIGDEWQTDWENEGIRIWTNKRANQKIQNPKEFDQLLNSVRERVEGTFDQLKEGGRSVEKTLAKTIGGLCSRIISKITGIIYRIFLKKFYCIDLLTYTVS